MRALGRHVLVELFGCKPNLLNDVVYIKKSMEQAARKAAATIINSTFHHFTPYGVSGVVVIQESHLAIHTWPEYGFAAVDVFTCGDSVDPWQAYKVLEVAFEANHGAAIEMGRGQQALLGPPNETMAWPKGTKTTPKQSDRDSIWFTELHDNIAVSIRHAGDKVFEKQTRYQNIEVYDTHQFGRMLTLDGVITCTETDEVAYHEMAAHVPMFTSNAINRILVIGGGDGGVARELLRHQQLERVVIVEIDQAVVEAAKAFMPGLSAGLNDPRVELVIANGVEYVKKQPAGVFDLVIIDADIIDMEADEITLFQHVHRLLTAQGILVTRTGTPGFDKSRFAGNYKSLHACFGVSRVFCYLVHVSTYPTGLWSFSFCAKGNINPRKSLFAEKAATFAEAHKLSYYNAEVHQSAFALPNYIKRFLNDL